MSSKLWCRRCRSTVPPRQQKLCSGSLVEGKIYNLQYSLHLNVTIVEMHHLFSNKNALIFQSFIVVVSKLSIMETDHRVGRQEDEHIFLQQCSCRCASINRITAAVGATVLMALLKTAKMCFLLLFFSLLTVITQTAPESTKENNCYVCLVGARTC